MPLKEVSSPDANLNDGVESLRRALREALDQQTATSEILRVISSSPTDVQPVFDTIIQNATRLCEAFNGTVFRFDGSLIHVAAHHNLAPEAVNVVDQVFPISPGTGTVTGRAILTRAVTHVRDVASDPEHTYSGLLEAGFRAVLSVPMLRGGAPIGAITVTRREVRPFSDNQIALLQTFADQAVIAIENVRLFKELEARNRDLTTALDQQTATSNILRVISESQTDVQPVFDAIVDSAVRLLRGNASTLSRIEGDQIALAAMTSTDDPGDASQRARFPMSIHSEGNHAQAVRNRVPLHSTDAHGDPRLPETQHASARLRGYRSLVVVPLVRHDEAVGALGVARREPGGFTDDEIALLKTFADQAVIAIENVRLFTELQAKNSALTTAHAQVTEALEQQTATAEILRVISRSPTDLRPVMEAVAENAARLCDATDAQILRGDGETITLVASYGRLPTITTEPRWISRRLVGGRAIIDRMTLHISDVRAVRDEFPDSATVQLGVRTVLATPLLREGVAIGVIMIRRMEVRPFSDNQIALLQTFADQAVIAIENVRLFKELEARNRDLTEALDQKTATAEILRVISGSPTDVVPIFATIAESAWRLCAATRAAVYRFEGGLVHFVAHHGYSAEAVAIARALSPSPPTRDRAATRAIFDRTVVHIPDVFEDAEHHQPDLARAAGVRSLLGVPMLRDGEPLGAIVVGRGDSGPFSEGQIALLQTFADQAVIAIENVRLFTELQEKNQALTQAHAQVSEALEQQTATSEILRVISHSPTDVQPVLDAVAESAARLCGAIDAIIQRVDGGMIYRVAHFGAITSMSDVRPVTWDTPSGRAIMDRRTIHVDDILDEFAHGNYLEARALQQGSGFRTVLVVPLMREDAVIGIITIRRLEMRPFTGKQIALLQTFADQAVIAIENVRLFKELEARNHDLTEALEQQTATAEILRVISRSQTDVQPVFDTIVRSAVRLCAGLFSALFQFDGELLHHVAHHNFTPEGLEELRRIYPARPSRASGPGRAILERAVVHIPDVEVDPEYQHLTLSRATGFRSGLYVPMLREGAPIGAIAVARAEPGPFSDNQIELLKTFADQAVIAVENVRLFKELEARTGQLTQSVEKLTALGEVSRAVSSTLDVETVLDTIVSRASQLAGAAGCSIYEYDEGGERFELRAMHNYDAEFVAALRAVPLRRGEGLMGRAAEIREPIQIPDITQPGAYQSSVRDTLIRFGYRALLAVPLLREDQIIGSLSFNRKAPGEFPPEVVDVLKTFATQSALAIQNARLFREIADKSAQLEAASRHKSEFLANMSHELRTPLNAIIGFSEVLTERMFGELNDKQDEYLKDIHASGQHLLSLINDILDLSKIEAGRMELERSEFDLPNAVENALILVRERANRRGIKLASTIDKQLGVISGDERKVKQVLLNLLSNALKFTPEGGRIDVGARLDDHVAEVSVADTGIGIAPADQEAVFEEFRQVGAADKKAEGTGLGLALSRKFIELHGGRIWVKSQVGQGSTFTFTLPVRREE